MSAALDKVSSAKEPEVTVVTDFSEDSEKMLDASVIEKQTDS